MKALTNLIDDLTKQIGDDCSILPSAPDQPSDLAIACFQLAKKLNQDPTETAQSLAKKIDHPLVDNCRADGGYVNLFLNPNELAKLVDGLSVKDLLGAPESDQPVIIDYCSVNLAKRISVGHLRNLFIGRGLVNLYQYLGYRVITDNHIGDCGTVFGMWVAGYLQFSSPDELQKFGNQELNQIYLKVRQELANEKNQELINEIDDWSLSLEQGDPMAADYHQLFSQISLEDLNKSLQLLGIDFDYCLPESFYLDQAHTLVEELIRDNLAVKQPDGSVIVDLTSESIDAPLLLLKSNGGCLYATIDVATIKYRQEEFNPQRVIYVVGLEQQFHFKQLFAFNRIANYSTAELIHCHYGLILQKNEDGTQQKMSSRDGSVLLEEVIDRAVANTKKIVKSDLDDKNIKIIAQAALTFAEFCYRRTTNVVFDWQKMFSLTTMSGPYVQYATVRLNSILAKADVDFSQPIFNDKADFVQEKQLLFDFLRYPDVIAEAFANHDLSLIADHIYQVSRQLNRYYEKTKILPEEVVELKTNRLWLIDKVASQLIEALSLLGVEVPDQM